MVQKAVAHALRTMGQTRIPEEGFKSLEMEVFEYNVKHFIDNVLESPTRYGDFYKVSKYVYFDIQVGFSMIDFKIRKALEGKYCVLILASPYSNVVQVGVVVVTKKRYLEEGDFFVFPNSSSYRFVHWWGISPLKRCICGEKEAGVKKIKCELEAITHELHDLISK
jgi:hypothetical protein